MSNSAYRLLDVLKSLRRYPSGPIEDAWRQAFGIDAGDHAKLSFLLGDVYHLIAEVRRDIDSLESVRPELHTSNVDAILRTFTTFPLREPMERIHQQIGDNILAGLEHTGEAIRHQKGQYRLQQPSIDLKEWEAKLDSLLEDVAGAEDIDPDLKAFLLERLEALRTAILRYRVRGLDAFRDYVESTFGKTFLEQEQLARSKDDPLWVRFKDEVLYPMAAIFTVTGGNLPQLASSVVALLESGLK